MKIVSNIKKIKNLIESLPEDKQKKYLKKLSEKRKGGKFNVVKLLEIVKAYDQLSKMSEYFSSEKLDKTIVKLNDNFNKLDEKYNNIDDEIDKEINQAVSKLTEDFVNQVKPVRKEINKLKTKNKEVIKKKQKLEEDLIVLEEKVNSFNELSGQSIELQEQQVNETNRLENEINNVQESFEKFKQSLNNVKSDLKFIKGKITPTSLVKTVNDKLEIDKLKGYDQLVEKMKEKIIFAGGGGNTSSGGGGASTLAGLNDTDINSPSDNQFLRYDGNNWINETVSTAGEANTASNIGASGFGWFNGKSSVDLQFRNIYSSSNLLGLSLNSTNHLIVLGFSEAGINNSNIINGASFTNIANATTDNLAEGNSNFYYTEGRFDTSFGNKTTDDLTEGSNLYYTDERAQDAVGTILSDTSDITLTYNDEGTSIGADLTTTGVNAGSFENVTVDNKGRVTGATTYWDSKHITIQGPTDSEDVGIWNKINYDLTIQEMVGVIQGVSSPSISVTIRHGSDRSAAGIEVVTGGNSIISTSTGTVITSFNDATIPANSFIWLETTGSNGGVSQLEFTFNYTID